MMRRRNLIKHKYTNEELHDILEMMWKAQDEVGTLVGQPDFVRKYVREGLVPVELEAPLLRDRVYNQICVYFAGQEG